MRLTANKKHKTFQSGIGVGQNLKKILGENNCPYVQSAIDLFDAFEPISELNREIVIAGALDEYSRIVQWDLLFSDFEDLSKFSADCAMIGALNQGTSRIFLVQNRIDVDNRLVFGLTKVVAEACALMGYEFVDHVAFSKGHYSSVFGSKEFAAFAECRNAVSEPIGETQFLWRWKCRNCEQSNATRISAMKGHHERPIQVSQCSSCNEFQWLTTPKHGLEIESCPLDKSSKHVGRPHAMHS